MTFFEHINRIKRLHGLIRMKSTGTPRELADRMSVSRATLFRHLDDLRSMGAPIAYEKDRQTYYYEEPFDLKL
ncbi:MAG TPA: HTH domain-containing protein [Saprospiraceae bacterium]|nr:HTH domain-containing protein [Saprospiraceae bacterium]HNM25099.1 HTH domain-containing protein [Saprospiraceae bacterium]